MTKTLDDIINEHTVVTIDSSNPERIFNAEIAKADIKQLFLELIGEDEFEDGMKGEDRDFFIARDSLRMRLRAKVEAL